MPLSVLFFLVGRMREDFFRVKEKGSGLLRV